MSKLASGVPDVLYRVASHGEAGGDTQAQRVEEVLATKARRVIRTGHPETRLVIKVGLISTATLRTIQSDSSTFLAWTST